MHGIKMSDKINSILEERQKRQSENSGDKFFQLLRQEGAVEHFLELRFRSGVRSAFKYDDLAWFNFDPEGKTIDMEFMGTAVRIEGRGLIPDLWQAIKSKRVSWIQESDTEMQDNPDFPCFIENILVIAPEDFGAEEAE
jgi:hypothetical protein